MTTASRTPAHSRYKRWAVLCIVSILLHLMVLGMAGPHIGLPSSPEPEQNVIVAALRPMPAPVPLPAIAAGATPVKPAPRPKRSPKPRPAPPPAAAESAPPDTTPQAIAQESTDGLEVPGTSVETAAAVAPQATSSTGAASPDSVPSGPEPVRYKVAPPPSAELKYDVKALREGQNVYGSGKINWQFTGSNFTVNGEAGILFFNVLTFQSEGTVGNFGIDPVKYSEKRFRKAETNTHFHRERNTISFSASTVSYPRTGGEQDRASVIWQLAGIGRGDASVFTPDAEIDIFVAGVRDAETWKIRVISLEEIEVGTGKFMLAWHMVRAPRPNSYDQKIDIWLAPQQQWYPVKLRYTDSNGDYLDMSLAKLSVASQQ